MPRDSREGHQTDASVSQWLSRIMRHHRDSLDLCSLWQDRHISSGNSTNLAFKIYLYLGDFLPLLCLKSTLCISYSVSKNPKVHYPALLFFRNTSYLQQTRWFPLSSVVAYVSPFPTWMVAPWGLGFSAEFQGLGTHQSWHRGAQ